MKIRTGLTMFAAAVVLASPCLAQAVKLVSLPFFVTVSGTTSSASCTFQGVSFSTTVSHTLTQLVPNSVSFSNLVVNKVPDYCSPVLNQLTVNATLVPTVVISMQVNNNGSGIEVRRITFSKTTITSSVLGANSQEVLTFKFITATIHESLLGGPDVTYNP